MEKSLLNGDNSFIEEDYKFIQNLDLKEVAEKLINRSKQFSECAKIYDGKVFSIWEREMAKSPDKLVNEMIDSNYFSFFEFSQISKIKDDLFNLLQNSNYKNCWISSNISLDRANSLIGVEVKDLQQLDGQEFGFLNPVLFYDSESFTAIITIDLPNSYNFFHSLHSEKKQINNTLQYCDLFIFWKK